MLQEIEQGNLVEQGKKFWEMEDRAALKMSKENSTVEIWKNDSAAFRALTLEITQNKRLASAVVHEWLKANNMLLVENPEK